MAAFHRERRQAEAEAAEAWRLPTDRSRGAAAQRAQRLEALRAALDDLLAGTGTPASENVPFAPPEPGELLLAFHPLPEGWAILAADGEGAAAGRIGSPEEALGGPGPGNPEALSALLLAPFAERIRRAGRLRVLAYGALRGVDFHALPFGGASLLEALPVVYGLDLAHPAPSPCTAPRRALVVGDPRGDLPEARAEAREVARALSASGWEVEHLEGGAATRTAVREALGRAALFHYAGHAAFEGWDSALPLAAESRLTLDDLLALERAPELVVLSGCETGRTDGETPVETLGLAHAFAAAGAGAVLAAVRPVEDRAARALMETTYAALGRGAAPAAALRRAQLAARTEEPESGWAGFRVFVP